MSGGIFQQISSVPWFSTASFGIVAMVLVGMSWCLTGLVMGRAPKRGIDTGLVQFFGGLVSITVSLTTVLISGASTPDSRRMLFLTLGMFYSSGALNFCTLQLMSAAMQRGPNGIIWSIIQSGMVISFIVGVVFFGAALTLAKLCGIILLLAAIVCFGLAKDNSRRNGGGWRLLAFGAFTVCSIQQTVNTLPAYFPESRQVSSVLCTLATSSGAVTASIVFTLCTLSGEKVRRLWENVRNPHLWKYVLCLQFFSLLFSWTLFYPGLFAMGKHGMGMVCFPLMVGSCILCFTLVGLFWLREKVRPLQIAALLMCLMGLACLAAI